MVQLRNLGAIAGADDGILADVGELAFFSEPKAEATPDVVPAISFDIVQSRE